MPRFVRVFAICGLVGLAIASVPAGAQVQVRGVSAIPLVTPVSDFTTFNLVSRLLADANVPFGLEGPSTDSPQAPIDSARAASSTGAVIVDTRSLDAALKQLAEINPRLRWSRQGALVVVRFGPERDGFLDQRVSRFSVTGASPRGALEALLTVFDASRSSGFGVVGAGRPPAGREGEAGARSGAPITLSLTDVTVLDALNAIATANGAMSWMVNYDPGRALYESATIQFIEGGYRVTALSKLSLAQPIPLAKPEAHGVVTLPRVIVSVPMNAASLLTTVERLSASLAVPVGAEVTTGFPLLSPRDLVTPAVGHGASGPATGLAGGVVGDVPRGVPAASSGQLARAYDLTGLTMPEALTKLAEWNLEYAWTEDNGVYHIRPRAVHAASQALDARVDRFANRYNDVPSAALAIRDLIDRLTAPRPPSPTVITSWVSSGSRTPDMQKPLTLDLSNLTVRQLLDAMVTEHGRLSWTFETRSQANGVSTWQLRIHSFDGSTSSPPPIVR